MTRLAWGTLLATPSSQGKSPSARLTKKRTIISYAVSVRAVTASLAIAGAARTDISPSRGGLAPAMLIGAAVFVLWVAIDKWIPYPHLGARTGFNPFSALAQPAWAARVFLAVRFY